MPLATSTSTLSQMLVASLAKCDDDNSDVSSCLDHLYLPHGKYSLLFGQKLRCLGKGVMLRAGRATTAYLRKAILGAQAIAVVLKIWKIWDGFHKELYLYGHPLHLRPLQGRCVPSIIGVFSTSEGLANIAMEPPHPHAWRVADRLLSMDEKGAIVEAYAQIHARGVLHGDVVLRHMLIGRDGKPTIINFRQASCLQPAMKIGLSGCSAYEFQLEMRQVKFLLDYQGAREFEYQLARECHSTTRMNTRDGVMSITPLPISESTLQQWDASTLEDLPPPSLPFYVPNTPEFSIQPVSWIPGDNPLSADNSLYPDSEGNQLRPRTSLSISSIHGLSSQVDNDDDTQSPPSTSHPHSCLKGKQREHNGNPDVRGTPTHKHKRFYLESSPPRTDVDEMFPDTRHFILGSEQRHHSAGASSSLWSYLELTTFEPSMSVAPRPAVISDNCLASQSLGHSSADGAAPPDQLPSSSLLSHDIERFLPLLCAPTFHIASHVPSPGHDSYNSHLFCSKAEEFVTYETTPQLDYTSDSSSNSSDSTSGSSYGLADSEFSSLEDLMMFPNEVPPLPTIDGSSVSLLFNPLSDANFEFTGEPLLENLRTSFNTKELTTVHCKRKRLFLTEEDEYGERARKQRCVEQ